MKRSFKRIFAILLMLALTVCAVPFAAAEDGTNEPPIRCDVRYTRDAYLLFFSPFNEAQSMEIADPESICSVTGKDKDGSRASVTFTPSMLQREAVEGKNGYSSWRTELFTLALPKESLYALQYVTIPQGAFAQSDGTPLPRMQIHIKDESRTRAVEIQLPSSKYPELLVLQPDADCLEGDVVLLNHLATIYTDALNKPRTSLFSVQRTDADGTVAEMPLQYDESVYPDSYFFPVSAGTAEYTVYACGVPILTRTVQAISRTEYEEIRNKDRSLSVAKGLALIPALPLFLLWESGAYAGALSLALFTWYSPLLVPVGALGGAIGGFGLGAAAWAQTIGCFLTGNKSLIGGNMILPDFLFARKIV